MDFPAIGPVSELVPTSALHHQEIAAGSPHRVNDLGLGIGRWSGPPEVRVSAVLAPSPWSPGFPFVNMAVTAAFHGGASFLGPVSHAGQNCCLGWVPGRLNWPHSTLTTDSSQRGPGFGFPGRY